MAETAAILAPEKTVLIPDPDAGCSLASSITADQLRDWKAEHPGAVVVSYVNTTAEVKAETDYCCTSGNARAVIEAIPRPGDPVPPDIYLGLWLERVTGRKPRIWMGECHVHAGIRPADIERWQAMRPTPSCSSTPSAAARARRWHSATNGRTSSRPGDGPLRERLAEAAVPRRDRDGILHRLAKEAPGKRFEPRRRRRCVAT